MIWGVVTPALVGSWAFWMIEWVESGGLHAADTPLFKTLETLVEILNDLMRLRSLRSSIARGVFAWVMLANVGWWLLPLCLDIRLSASSPTSAAAPKKTQVTILGYANAYGAPYLMFYLLMFSLVYMCTPLPGQVVLGLAAVALLAYLEALDGVRDAKEIERVVRNALNPLRVSTTTDADGTITATKNPATENAGKASENEDEAELEPTTFLTTLPIILLSFITFYATGHQSTVSSMQWKTGFVLTENVKYPWSVISVVLNTVGPFLLLGVAGAALVGGWKRSPTASSRLPSSPISPANITNKVKPSSGTTEAGAKDTEEEQEDIQLGQAIEHSSFLTILLIQLYFLILLFGASTSAAVLRRHLMVWKVFAPRFMAAVVEMGIVDLGVCLSVALFGGRVVEKVGRVLGRVGVGRVVKVGDAGGSSSVKEGKEE
jgi:phosphatidylinositol glycan class O